MSVTALESLLNEGPQTQSEELNRLVASSLRSFIEQVFMKMAPSFIMVLSCRKKETCNFFRDLLQFVFYSVHYMNVQLVYVDPQNPQRVPGSRMYNLLLVDSFEAFLDIDIISYTRNYNTNEFYYIFLMQKDNYIFQDMKSIFTYCWINHIINCNIQYQNSLGEIYMYSYFPFSLNKCYSTDPEFINQFIANAWLHELSFPSKLNNFYSCPLVVAVHDIPPYAYSIKNIDGHVSYDGFEIDMIKCLSKLMNFTLDIRTSDFPDKLFSGPLEMVSSGVADVAIGFFGRHPHITYLKKYSYTFPHYQNHVISVIYLNAHKINTLESLLFPFNNNVWYILSVTLLIMVIVTVVLRKKQPLSLSIFEIIACGLGMTIKLKSKLTHSIFIFTSWLWSSFLIRAMYSGLLYHLLRNNIYSAIPLTISDAVHSGFHAVMNNLTYNDISSIPIFENTRNTTSIVLDSDDQFAAISYIENSRNKYLYTVLSKDFLIYFMHKKNKPGLFFIIPETIKVHQLCTYLPKHSFLIDQLDWQIILMRSVGLVQYWGQRYVNTTYFIQYQIHMDSFLNQLNLNSIYSICAVCYLIALIIFVAELLTSKSKFLKRLFE